MTLLIVKDYRDCEIKVDEMDKACKTHGKEGK